MLRTPCPEKNVPTVPRSRLKLSEPGPYMHDIVHRSNSGVAMSCNSRRRSLAPPSTTNTKHRGSSCLPVRVQSPRRQRRRKNAEHVLWYLISHEADDAISSFVNQLADGRADRRSCIARIASRACIVSAELAPTERVSPSRLVLHDPTLRSQDPGPSIPSQELRWNKACPAFRR